MSSETLNHTGSFAGLASGSGSRRISRRAPAKSPGSFFTEALATVQLWLERSRQRRTLAAMEHRLLDDIGISRAEADHEYRKPFWRA